MELKDIDVWFEATVLNLYLAAIKYPTRIMLVLR